MVHNHNKIILNLMIKNESNIIQRCIEHTVDYIDAISILDTGSTDNTIEICKKYLEQCGKPYKISIEPFKNFGYNRTISFQKVKELCIELNWDENITYALAIDADMIIKPSPQFKDFKMTLPGYTIQQHNNLLQYYNKRLMKCSYDWKCIGSTHEYWNGEPTDKIPYEIIYIKDVNDGGCKSDKYQRDIKLLTEDLKTDPTNGRTYFYLAQSFKGISNFQEAIINYKKRIQIGGWYEEVWYSHYQIANCYKCINQPEEMEYWALKAFKFHPKRAEPLYLLTKYFRECGQYYKSYHYYLQGINIPYPKNDTLFIHSDIYNGLFNYENTLLHSHITHKTLLN